FAPKTKGWVEASIRIFTRCKWLSPNLARSFARPTPPSGSAGHLEPWSGTFSVSVGRQTSFQERSMSDLVVYGFPRSTFVNVVRLVLTHKEVPYRFHDLEPEMGKPSHLALHPFNRVPILKHGDFAVYETSAIVSYLEETFPKPSLQPKDIRDRARMNQWIS